MDEIETLRMELDHFRAEKEKIREVLGRVGGKSHRQRDRAINAAFLIAVVGFFAFDVLRHALQWDIPLLPPSLLLEIAVLLVSVKIIWMIHRQAKVDHFQFWVLNSIEFQISLISRRLAALEERLQDAEAPSQPGSGGTGASG